MGKVSFEGIGAVIATFPVGENVHGGQVVKLAEDGSAAGCGDGDTFCGVALEPRAGFGGVQVKGFVTVACDQALTPGWATLAADGQGGVKQASQGVTALVVRADGDGTAVLCL